MALYTSSWDRPIQGISQQPPKNRIGGQCSDQKNGVASAVRGLYKRNGSDFVTEFESAPGAKLHSFFNSLGQGYLLSVQPNSSNIRATKLFGDFSTISINADSYIQTPDPVNDLQLVSISDTTFFINKRVVPTKKTSSSSSKEKRAIVNVQFADYGREYAIYIDGAKVSNYITPDGSQSAHIKNVDTSYVASQLYQNSYVNDSRYRIYEPLFDSSNNRIDNFVRGGIQYESFVTLETGVPRWRYYQPVGSTGLGQLSGFNVTLQDNTIIFEKTNGSEFDIRTKDGANGRDLIAIKGRVISIDQLPTVAPNGYTVEVVGNSGKADPYFLKAESTDAGKIRWIETVAPLTPLGLNSNTMPRTLLNTGESTFAYSQGAWSDRRVGSEDTNPDPAFVTDAVPIRDIGVFQNRLVILAGESVTYSRAGEFFELYRSSVQDLLDTDPISVFADTDRDNSIFAYANLDGDLVFFSKNGQFLQSGEQPITPANATLRYVSTFEAIDGVHPVAAGDVIFFPFSYGGATGIREFYTDSLIATKKARPITDHVSQLLQGTATQLITSRSRDILFVLAEPKNRIYVYQWLWQGQDRVQSAWSYWESSDIVDEILYAFIEVDQLYICARADGKVQVEVLDLSDAVSDPLGFEVKLDHKIPSVATRDGDTWRAVIPPSIGYDFVVIQGVGCTDAGSEVAWEFDGDFIITQDELGLDEAPIIFGRPYEFLYEPTMPFMTDQSGRVIDTDRLTLNDVNVNYDKLGSVKVNVVNDYGAERSYDFNGRVLGRVNNIVGLKENISGTFKFPVRQQSDRVTFKLTSSDPYEFQLRSMEWRGRFNQRGRRV